MFFFYGQNSLEPMSGGNLCRLRESVSLGSAPGQEQTDI